METLGSRLKFSRKLRKLTQKDLALAAGVSQQVISYIEVGQTNFTQDVFKLADVLKVNPKWLSTGEGVMDYDDSSITNEDKTFLSLLRRLSTKQKNDAVAKFHELIIQNEQVVKEYNERGFGQSAHA